MGRRAGELLAQEGCAVGIVALESDTESIDDAVEGIRSRGGNAIGIAGNMTVKDDIQRVGTRRLREHRRRQREGEDCGFDDACHYDW